MTALVRASAIAVKILASSRRARAIVAFGCALLSIGCGGGAAAPTNMPLSGGSAIKTSGGHVSGDALALHSMQERLSVELSTLTRPSATSSRGAPPRRKRAAEPPLLAMADPPSGKAPSGSAVDGRSGPLLVYQATVHLAVFEVEKKLKAVLKLAGELGGHMSQRASDHVVIRVPAQRFEDAMARLETLGDVLARRVASEEVTEAFRDLRIRLSNAERVRDRLAQLLHRATNVEQSLKIERELDRLTERIEQLKGKLRALEDRIAFSTITVAFKTKEQESLEPGFSLPFDWLRALGLSTLLELR